MSPLLGAREPRNRHRDAISVGRLQPLRINPDQSPMPLLPGKLDPPPAGGGPRSTLCIPGIALSLSLGGPRAKDLAVSRPMWVGRKMAIFGQTPPAVGGPRELEENEILLLRQAHIAENRRGESPPATHHKVVPGVCPHHRTGNPKQHTTKWPNAFAYVLLNRWMQPKTQPFHGPMTPRGGPTWPPMGLHVLPLSLIDDPGLAQGHPAVI